MNLEFVPYEALHDKIIAAQGAGDRGYDVVLFDVIWPAEFATKVFLHGRDGPRPRRSRTTRSSTAHGPRSPMTASKYGMPWILDTKYLFYNTDMLAAAGFSAPPKTWPNLSTRPRRSRRRASSNTPIVGSWSQSEAMICDYALADRRAFGGDFLTRRQADFQTGGVA